ncbi:MAG: chemotaxis protein CheD [Proteobacteria bacterium]|nr:chemotaxis protein CheD [Pseudomonadota bacterium]
MVRNFLYVSMGKCVISESPDVLICKGLGSCIALCLYDTYKKLGVLAHILLPEGQDHTKPFFYANLAVPEIICELKKRGSNKNILWAKIIGGANIFLNEENNLNIGTRNIQSIMEHLENYKIRVLSTDLGGNSGRNVFFDLKDGSVRIFTYEKGEYII